MENQNQTNQDQTQNSAAEYIEAIKQLKATTVSKEDYDALQAEKKQLLDSLLHGGADTGAEQTETPDYETIKKDARNKLFGGDGGELSNLEYCKTALQLREAVLKTDGIDIFVGSGHQYTPEQSDYDKAQRVAEVMAECIEAAEGNSDIFTAQLMNRTNDVSLPGTKRPARR